MAIEIKFEQPDRMLYRGDSEVPKYLGDLMDKDAFNDEFCWWWGPLQSNNWMYLPSPNDFNRSDWKKVIKCFAHFGHDLEALKNKERQLALAELERLKVITNTA